MLEAKIATEAPVADEISDIENKERPIVLKATRK